MQREKIDIKQFNKVILVHNVSSGSQTFSFDLKQQIRILQAALRVMFGPEKFQDIQLSSYEEMLAVGEKVCTDKIEWVIVAGGDGSLRALVETFVKNDYYPYVSVFPAGTVNLVAKELSQSNMATTWSENVGKGNVTPVWLGKANDRIFLTVAGIGVDSLVVDNVGQKEKKYLSKLAYLRQGGIVAGQEILLHNWKYKFQVMVDDDGVWHDATSVIVSKSKYYAGKFYLTSGGSISKPALYVCLFTGGKAVDFLRYVALIAADFLNLDNSVNIIEAQKVQIKCNVKNFAAELDGDSVATSPLNISLLPKPIKFIS